MDSGFEWDPTKAAHNIQEHRVTFAEAQTVFADPLSLHLTDPEHSIDEVRFIAIGRSYRERLLVVVYVERGERIRIISARKATGREKSDYEEGV